MENPNTYIGKKKVWGIKLVDGSIVRAENIAYEPGRGALINREDKDGDPFDTLEEYIPEAAIVRVFFKDPATWGE